MRKSSITSGRAFDAVTSTPVVGAATAGSSHRGVGVASSVRAAVSSHERERSGHRVSAQLVSTVNECPERRKLQQTTVERQTYTSIKAWGYVSTRGWGSYSSARDRGSYSSTRGWGSYSSSVNARGRGHAEVELARDGGGVQTSSGVQVGVSTHATNPNSRAGLGLLPSLQTGKLQQVSLRQHRYHRGQCPRGLGPRPCLRKTRGWVGKYPHRLLAEPVENSLRASCE